jgi:hypothetical protein
LEKQQLQVYENENPQVVEYVPSIAQTLEQAAENLNQMTAFARGVMRYGVDYDKIPGTPKPSLLKPGAERLLQFFGLGHRVECINKAEDWEKGFFFYHYKVTIIKTYPTHELIVAECEGSANIKEDRYRWRWVTEKKAQELGVSVSGCLSREKQGKYGDYTEYRIENPDPYTLVNTLQKMAIKRALVGATLQATGASGLFTQDVEDMGDQIQRSSQSQKNRPQQQPKTSPSGEKPEKLVSENQIKYICTLSSKLNMSDQERDDLVFTQTGKKSKKELTATEASQLINYLQGGAA